jgi:bifunctional N-acetylglucosamine-1-phosphate-uridyltransferase/glucosamine-1-phosphate-acetyltransferase GlmU-like protein
VRAALPLLPDGPADALVVWGSQPLISSATLARSVAVHQALGDTAMLFPTAVTRKPYAPIQRDLRGYVVASRETALEGVPRKPWGETNIGAFLVDGFALKATLGRLHAELWDAAAGRYRTRTGSLGFPNEMAKALAGAGEAVIALPIAKEEESMGLRSREGCEEVQRLMGGGRL